MRIIPFEKSTSLKKEFPFNIYVFSIKLLIKGIEFTYAQMLFMENANFNMRFIKTKSEIPSEQSNHLKFKIVMECYHLANLYFTFPGGLFQTPFRKKFCHLNQHHVYIYSVKSE